MMTLDLDKIGKLKFQEKIIINNISLIRTDETRDLNTKEQYYEYYFYQKWNKKINILPNPSHIVKIYVDFLEKQENEKTIHEFQNYKKAILINLKKKKEEIIESIR